MIHKKENILKNYYAYTLSDLPDEFNNSYIEETSNTLILCNLLIAKKSRDHAFIE